MLQKRRDLGSIPDGLGVTATAMNKGTAVVRKFVSGVYTYAKPATEAESNAIYGFITLRIDDSEHPDSYHDVIPANKKAVAYTWVKNNEWATSEFVGTLAKGDKCFIANAGAEAGKVKKVATETATLEVIAVSPAMVGYETALVTVKVL